MAEADDLVQDRRSCIQCAVSNLHAEMPEDVAQYTEVSFKGDRRCFYMNNAGLCLEDGAMVVVEAEKGNDLGMVVACGEVAYVRCILRGKSNDDHLRRVVRSASESDLVIANNHRSQEESAFRFCLLKIDKLHLPMKLVDVEYQFDRNRITFYFTADGRVDFRELVKELAAEYRTRIELRQIGPRDEARRMGGFGNCGRELCCSSWLENFEPISTGMAKLQNLTLNPFKLAGQCGRLKCCLAFESQVYEDQLKRFPPLETVVTTKKGTARVEKIDIFQDAIYLHYEKSDEWERLELKAYEALTTAKA
jgi:cell fate regulator YaaT (PSP1 superfamily)